MDSSYLLGLAVSSFAEVLAVSIDYGQRHRRELEAARSVAKFYGVEHHIVSLESVFTTARQVGAQSALLGGDDVPEGHYAAETMIKTIVPNRNLLFLSALTSIGISWRPGAAVGIATHSGDHFIYPDCRPDFINQAEKAIAYGIGDPEFLVWTPFITITKAAIVQRGYTMGVPFHLTWSCYNGGEVHCSKCGTCYERREAFEIAGVVDPTEYALNQEEWASFKVSQRPV